MDAAGHKLRDVARLIDTTLFRAYMVERPHAPARFSAFPTSAAMYDRGCFVSNAETRNGAAIARASVARDIWDGQWCVENQYWRSVHGAPRRAADVS